MNDRAKYKMTLLRQREDRELATKKPLPDRITAALNLAGLYGPEVDRMFGGEEPMVDEWEAGTRIPTPEQIRLLADLAGVIPGFFYRLPEAPGGPGFICTSDGCESVWLGPPPPVAPMAEVVPIFSSPAPPDPTPEPISEESPNG
ncbi:hypothetical protein ACIBQX_11610 [Nonomuraea sp. NPDC049714]|uniref:hypothetical protein n=1 Tax=Nonomuraea sp. NPDC049714 TaxID=3364357 RepID=UPI0037B8C7A8